MRYADFRDLGMFTGSGAIEGGMKAIVVQRAKQSGMHWTIDGAAGIIALHCQRASGRWNDFVGPGTAQPDPWLRAAVWQTPPLRTPKPTARSRSSPTRLSCTPAT